MANLLLLPPFSESKSLVTANSPTIQCRGSVPEHVAAELDVSRLNRVHQHLWLAGRPQNSRPLHRQVMLQRELIITEQADLHLVWRGNRMFVKPLPRFLLNYRLFKENLCSGADLHASACGLLHSYTQLVRHESDLKIAVELGLLPKDTEWDQWTVFADEILEKVDTTAFQKFSRRYIYGELRLARLNWIYRVSCGEWNRGYHYTYTEYGNFFQTNFTWVLLIFAYASVVLSAMQVGLAAQGLAAQQGPQDNRLGRTSFGFSLAVLVVVAGVVGLIVSWFVLLFLSNLVATLVYQASTRNRREWAAAGRVVRGC